MNYRYNETHALSGHIKKCTTLSKSEFEILQQGNHHIVFNCGSCLQDNSRNKQRLEKLEKEVSEHSKMIKTMNEVILLLRDQNQTLHQQNEMIVQLVNSDKTLEQRIKAQIEEALDDQKEREETQNNLIIFNVQETTIEEDEEREDLENVRQIINYIDPDYKSEKLLYEKITRLGKRKTNAKQPRPIKVTLESPHHKTKILKGTKKLKNNPDLKHISLSHEKTKKEREEYQKLKNEMEERKKETGQDLVIYNNEVMLRSTRDSKIDERKLTRRPNSQYNNNKDN